MRSVRPAKERRLGKVKHQRIVPARRWRRENCGRINRNGARQIGLYCSCKHRIHLHCTTNLTKPVRQCRVKLGAQPAATYSSQSRLRRGTDNRKISTASRPFQPGFHRDVIRSEEHTSELQSLMRISYAVFCLKKKKTTN